MMTTFDFCDTTLPCGQRDVTTVAPQALALINNRFFHEQSQALARRVAAEEESDARRQATRAWRLALGRAPTESELTASLTHLADQEFHFSELASDRSRASADAPNLQALASLCHVLLISNEFIYVD